MVLLFASLLALSSLAGAKEFLYGVAHGSDYNLNAICDAIGKVNPTLVMNWGGNNLPRKDLNVCNNPNIKYVPNMWGRASDPDEIASLPSGRANAPWGVLLENEPNWKGFGNEGSNILPVDAANRYKRITQIINDKWGVGVVKLISPSPVSHLYNACPGNRNGVGCTYQDQWSWLDEYFKACNCLNDVWAINLHDYSCNIKFTQDLVAETIKRYPNKNIFFGEIGCGANNPDAPNYIRQFMEWAYDPADWHIVGMIWPSIYNNVGTPGTELVSNGQLTNVGRVWDTFHSRFPVISWPVSRVKHLKNRSVL